MTEYAPNVMAWSLVVLTSILGVYVFQYSAEDSLSFSYFRDFSHFLHANTYTGLSKQVTINYFRVVTNSPFTSIIS
jgi:hypothetical protein